MDQSIRDTLYLLSCAVNYVVPEAERISSMELDKVFQISSKRMVSASVGFALNAAGIKDNQFAQAVALAQRKTVVLNDTLAKLLQQLKEAEIWYMPLKGAVLKDYFPRFGMREMADLDILVDDTRAADIENLMESMGFSVKSYGINNVDSYLKAPLTNVEIHKSLFGFQHDDEIYSYFKNVKEKLEPDEGNPFGFHFTTEDFYIYMIAHEYKHYQSSGTGLRSLLDTYVFLQRCDLNWAYVNQETAKLGIADFERNNREMALSLFSGDEIADSDIPVLDYYLESGTFGTLDHLCKKQNEQVGRRTDNVSV